MTPYDPKAQIQAQKDRIGMEALALSEAVYRRNEAEEWGMDTRTQDGPGPLFWSYATNHKPDSAPYYYLIWQGDAHHRVRLVLNARFDTVIEYLNRHPVKGVVIGRMRLADGSLSNGYEAMSEPIEAMDPELRKAYAKVAQTIQDQVIDDFIQGVEKEIEIEIEGREKGE